MTGYATTAQSLIRAYAEGLTRFDPEDIRFRDEQSTFVRFEVEVLHLIGASSTHDTRPGRVAGEDNDLVVQSKQEHEQVSALLCQEAEGRFDAIRHLRSSIERSGYGAAVASYPFFTYPRRSLFSYSCATCGGSGSVTCTGCGGSGTETCTHCGGMGSTWETETGTDLDGNTTHESVHTSCMWCSGGQVDCTACGGAGSVECRPCAGSGALTDISTPTLVVTPHFSLARVDPVDSDVEYALKMYCTLPLVADKADLQTRDVVAAEEHRRIVERARFGCPFYKATVSVNLIPSRVVAFGRRCAISDADCLVENLVRPDLERLRHAVANLRWYDWSMLLYGQRIARLVMASEVHQLVVELAPARSDAEDPCAELSRRLSKALSPSYIRELLEHLERLVLCTTRTNRFLGWSFAVVVGTPVAMNFVHQGSLVLAAGFVAVAGTATHFGHRFVSRLVIRWIGARRLVDFVRRAMAATI